MKDTIYLKLKESKLDTLKERYPNKKNFHHDKSKGKYITRNRGIRLVV